MAFPTKKFDVQSSEYSTIQETLVATKVAGEYVVHHETAGFYFVGGDSGDIVTIVTRAPRVKVFKKAAETWEEGQVLFYDPAQSHVTNVEGILLFIGYALEAIDASDTVGFMEFDGFMGFPYS